MKSILSAGVVGFIFALGLGISGMTQPQKVVGFLDVFGNWDPSLMFVMIGSIAVHFILFRLIKKRGTPLFSSQWHLPTKTQITPSLVIGSVVFGVGWGLGGYCPGPALVSLGSIQARPFIFITAMIIGMLIFKVVDKNLKIVR